MKVHFNTYIPRVSNLQQYNQLSNHFFYEFRVASKIVVYFFPKTLSNIKLVENANSFQSKTVKSRNLKFVRNSVFKNQPLVKNEIAETYH